jgi:hypothetical protein
VKIPKTGGFVLILLILQLTIAGCGSTPTQRPTDVPPPTATPDPYIGWLDFVDPWSRYSVRYPPGWYLFPAPFDSAGYATTISTVDIGAEEEPSRELDVPQDELLIWFSFSGLDLSEGMGLEAWAESHFHPGGNVVERVEETIAGVPAVVELIDLYNGQRAKIVHFSTASGILSIFGQPWGNSQSELFDLLVRTVSFQQ